MKKTGFVLSAAVLIALTSCSGKLGTLTSDNFKVMPNPLMVEQGQVPATISGTFPEKFMNRKAVVKVIPELRYANGKAVRSEAATFQGEKVLGNDQQILYKVGGNYTMKASFPYEGVNKAELFLMFDAKIGKKTVELPAIKVADGIIATSEMYHRSVAAAQPCIATDAFQRVVKKKQEANIQFLIQQANLRKSELKNNSVTEFVSMLQRINKERESLNIDNVEVSAYASPDGGLELNEKLAAQRQKNSEKYVAMQLMKAKLDAPIDAKYTAQDWEGFQRLVGASNIQDKDVILRVLAMYKDPEEREQQIRNMSAGFRELADGILPQLRRARLIINYETIGRSDSQILAQLKADPKKLSVEEILYAASLTDNLDEKNAIYETATRCYPNDLRAYNNIAGIEYQKGNFDAARAQLRKISAYNGKVNTPEIQANNGLLALQRGDISGAVDNIAKATDANGLPEVMGNLHLAQGNYALAVQDFGDIASNSAALAQIMNKDYAKAAITLNNIKNADGTTDYLRAILYARQGDGAAASAALKSALAKDPSLTEYANNDLELKNVSK